MSEELPKFEWKSNYEEVLKDLTDEQKLAAAEWVISNVVEHGRDGGSFRYFIYDRLGFGPEAYLPLYMAGGMEITNNFDLTKDDELIKVASENGYDKMKPLLGICDHDGCWKSASCGWPDENDKYRHTCGAHMKVKYD